MSQKVGPMNVELYIEVTKSYYILFLYADGILLIAPAVTELQSLFHACEKELNWLDIKINVKKSCYVRIGQRYDIKCANITSSQSFSLPWVKEIRGTYIISARQFRCSFNSGTFLIMTYGHVLMIECYQGRRDILRKRILL